MTTAPEFSSSSRLCRGFSRQARLVSTVRMLGEKESRGTIQVLVNRQLLGRPLTLAIVYGDNQ